MPNIQTAFFAECFIILALKLVFKYKNATENQMAYFDYCRLEKIGGLNASRCQLDVHYNIFG